MNRNDITDKGILAIVSGIVCLLSTLFLNLLVILAGYNRLIYPGTAYIMCAVVTVSIFVIEIIFLVFIVKVGQSFSIKDATDAAKLFEQTSRTRQQELRERTFVDAPRQQSVEESDKPDYSQEVFNARARAEKLLQSGTSGSDGPKMLN